MRKTKQFIYKRNIIYVGVDLFNPFARRQLGEVIPYFELIPRIGICIEKTTKSCGIFIGWLNLYFVFRWYWCFL